MDDSVNELREATRYMLESSLMIESLCDILLDPSKFTKNQVFMTRARAKMLSTLLKQTWANHNDLDLRTERALAKIVELADE